MRLVSQLDSKQNEGNSCLRSRHLWDPSKTLVGTNKGANASASYYCSIQRQCSGPWHEPDQKTKVGQ